MHLPTHLHNIFRQACFMQRWVKLYWCVCALAQLPNQMCCSIVSCIDFRWHHQQQQQQQQQQLQLPQRASNLLAVSNIQKHFNPSPQHTQNPPCHMSCTLVAPSPKVAAHSLFSHTHDAHCHKGNVGLSQRSATVPYMIILLLSGSVESICSIFQIHFRVSLASKR